MVDPIAPDQQESITQSLAQNQTLGQDAFLKLLLVQLQNQDPMEPVKNSDFIAQLAQFSSLEQLQHINKAVSSDDEAVATLELRKAIEGNTAVSLIGKGVEIPTDTVAYSGGRSVELGYHLAGLANQVDILIFGADGNLVRTLTEFSPEEGNGSLFWDGKDAAGRLVEAGNYHIVSAAVNGQGNPVTTSAALTGQVTGVRYEDGVPILTLDGGEAPLSAVTRIF